LLAVEKRFRRSAEGRRAGRGGPCEPSGVSFARDRIDLVDLNLAAEADVPVPRFGEADVIGRAQAGFSLDAIEAITGYPISPALAINYL
jgi:hypothetical protein